MNTEASSRADYRARYHEYIQSPEWMKRRERKLDSAGHKCAICCCKRPLEVHHLTYEHLFNEPMEDLMVLCYYHHRAIEDAIFNGEVPRRGDLQEIVSKTFTALRAYGKKLKKLALEKEKEIGMPRMSRPCFSANNRLQENMLNHEWFRNALNLPRRSFRSIVRDKYLGNPHKGSLVGNACAIYDRMKKRNRKQQKAFSTVEVIS